MKEEHKKIIEDAKNQLINNKGILIESPIIQQFVAARKVIDETAAKRNPLVKEYIDIHKEAEKNINSTIGRMTRAMKNVAAQHMIYATAVDMSTDEEEKERLKGLMDELANHPAVIGYGKYIEGLKYLSGEIDEVTSEVRDFFRNELAVPLQPRDSEYEMYRVGVDAYIEQENARLDNLENEIKAKLPKFHKELEKLDAKERAAGTIDQKLLKALDEEVKLKKAREEFERDKNSMTQQEQDKKESSLKQNENLNFLRVAGLTEKYGSPERKAILSEKNALEEKIKKAIPAKRKNLITMKSPAEQEKLDEYQKTIAKMKARELYSKQAVGLDVIVEKFVGDYLKRNDRPKKRPFRDRQTPSTICVAMMLLEGYKLEEIMDPTALLDKKKEIGQIYIKNREAHDVKWYVKTMFDGSNAMMDAFKEYVKEHKDELKTEQDLAMHAGTLGTLSMLCFDMLQELSFCKEADNGKLYKTVEEYDALQTKISGYECGADLGSSVALNYDLERLGAETVSLELGRRLRTKMLLEEIQKENPDIDSIIIDTRKQSNVDNQLVMMPEFVEIYGDSKELDINKLSKEHFKQLALMQSKEYIEKNNLRYDKVKHPTKVTVEPNAIGGVIKEGSQLECVLSCKGKQLVSTDIPVRVEDCFKNIESKDIRGEEKDNSKEFNTMMEAYDKSLKNIGYEKSDAENLAALKDLKEAAVAYMNAKRAQKGYKTQKTLDYEVDRKMLGKEKGGRSIFTTKGRDKYEFALEIVTNIVNLENKYGMDEMQKQDVEIQEPVIDGFER